MSTQLMLPYMTGLKRLPIGREKTSLKIKEAYELGLCNQARITWSDTNRIHAT